MAENVRTNTLEDLKLDPIPLEQINKNMIAERFREEMAIHNRLINDMASYMIEDTTEAIWAAPADAGTNTFRKVDTQAIPVTVGTTVSNANFGAPLEGYRAAVGWDAVFWATKTTLDFANAIGGIQNGDLALMRALIAKAVYNNVSTANVSTDWMRTFSNVTVDVKPMYNADGMFIPRSWDGKSFTPGTHTHYSAASNVTGAALGTIMTAAVNTVEEHFQINQTAIFINGQDEAKFKAIPGFVEALPSFINEASGVRTTNLVLNTTQSSDRQIGYLNNRLVIVKPWCIAGYAVVQNVAAGSKPLRRRQSDLPGYQGLQLESENVAFTLQANVFRRVVGFGGYNRASMAIVDLVNAAYTVPTIQL
jgi:hypothetical protein